MPFVFTSWAVSDPAPRLVSMIPTPPDCGSSRSAAVVNAEIRALMRRPEVRLSGEDRARYEVLVAEWTSASRAESLRGEVVKAA